MVTIIDYGIGNLRSIEKAFQAIGAEVLRTDRAEDIAAAERVVLPGVGAFGACAAEIRRRGLEQPILDAAASGRPFLGVCVGMQLLFDVSEEMGVHQGFGILPGRVVRFQGAYEPAACATDDGTAGAVEQPDGAMTYLAASHGTSGRRESLLPKQASEHATSTELKVPHMGWNTVAIQRSSPLLDGLEDEAFFYFVHSYHALPEHPADVLGLTTYGATFPAIVGRNKVFGVQFHPEKSQRNGLRILENFAMMP